MDLLIGLSALLSTLILFVVIIALWVQEPIAVTLTFACIFWLVRLSMRKRPAR